MSSSAAKKMIKISNFINICRICLNNLTEREPINSYVNKIDSCASVQISINDGLPQNVCPYCIENLETFSRFKKLIEDSDSFLRNVDHSEKITQNDEKRVESCLTETLTTLQKRTGSVCHVCSKIFYCVAKLTRHLRTHTDNKAYICELCGKSYIESCSLRKHFLAKHSGRPKPFQCAQCEHSFDLRTTLIRHQRTHTGERPFKCNICNKFYPSVSYLNKHKKIHQDRDKTFVCELCSKAFVEKDGLKAHLVTHSDEKPFECTACHKQFSSNASLKSHIKYIHTKEKSFVCHNCAKAFTTKHDLNGHMKIHTGQKTQQSNHQCIMCNKLLSSSTHLKVHVKAKHTGERPFSCNFCANAFITRQALKIHTRYHTGEKPFQCSHCGKGFATNDNRKVHERIHTGKRPYVCESCGAAFNQSSTLKTHMKNH